MKWYEKRETGIKNYPIYHLTHWNGGKGYTVMVLLGTLKPIPLMGGEPIRTSHNQGNTASIERIKSSSMHLYCSIPRHKMKKV